MLKIPTGVGVGEGGGGGGGRPVGYLQTMIKELKSTKNKSSLCQGGGLRSVTPVP